MQIILARHGETEWNRSEVFRGRKDIGLNENGLKEAELLAGYLARFEIEAIYSSPLKRAMQTAKAVARQSQAGVTVAPGLIDFNYGEWEGLSSGEVQARFGEAYALWNSHPERVSMPGGETLEDVRQRALALVNEVVARHKGTVLLVSHRVVHKVLICALLGLDNSHFWNIRLDTAALSIFSHEAGRFILTKHNETCFLEGMNKKALGDF